MDILIIAVLILLGLLFCVVELLIFPGVTLGGILSVVCSGGAIYLAFRDLGIVGGIVVVVAIIAFSSLAVAFSLRAKTWDRFSLKSEIESSSSVKLQDVVAIGQQGITVSRLSPMGKVDIDGCTYEAKSSDVYIDAKVFVEVVGYDNFSLIVKKVN